MATIGFKTGSKLPAHSTTMYGSVYQLDTASSVLEMQLAKVRAMDEMVYLVGRLQLLYGLRISEALGIRGTNIDGSGRIVVKGSKGSNDRLVIDSDNVAFWRSKRVFSTSLVFEFNRFYVYRIYKAVGIAHEVEGSLYKAVTHYPRHLFVKSIQNTTNNIDTTAQITGHKRVSNTKRYWKSKTK